uniref:Glycosyltransferase n=1 Tax=Polygala tenuifolia TaxID=355332 RepID=A0A4P2X5R2_9FABA|nr:UDP-glycosyltransferase [Polygala tenuifolia]
MVKLAELVFIPFPCIGHLVSAVELAKLLVQRDERISVTVLLISVPLDPTIQAYVNSLSSNNRIQYIKLPQETIPTDGEPELFLYRIVENHKQPVKDAVTQLAMNANRGTDSSQLAGFVVDMMCSAMIDVADEFGVPTYVFHPASAGFLAIAFHLQSIHDQHNGDAIEFNNPEAELQAPSCANPVPYKALPDFIPGGVSTKAFYNLVRKYRETKGILINTFMELESGAIGSMADGEIPPLYPIGPVINLKTEVEIESSIIIKWLDEQPDSSVVFLCFGSYGSFGSDQTKEIALALEKSGMRFLWTLRKPPPKGKIEYPKDMSDFEEFLPDGFLNRTADVGKVIGWAPQIEILCHRAIGGFVSHCGWNSTLESIYSGVPIATWPQYSEQQLNAFQLVKEYKLAQEIRMDYRKKFGADEHEDVVTAEEIINGLRALMEKDCGTRRRMKEMRDISKKVVTDGGSSHAFLGKFIDDVINNMPRHH